MNPNPDTKPAGTPDEQVARLIAGKLQQAGLIDDSQSAEVIAGLSSGSLRATDWTFIAEDALEREARHGEGTN